MDTLGEATLTASDSAELANATTTKGNGVDDPSQENKFQQAIAAWRNINLTSLIPTLDAAASDLVAHQRDALVQRKDLAQKTKDFRKLDDPAKLVEVKSILKAYQTYIDLITNQSKAIHSAFLQVYSPLSEAPDPYPLLDASIDSLVTVEETLPKITEENQHLHKSVNKLTSQLEEAEKRLQQDRSARQNLEESTDEKIKSVESSWTAVLNEKQNNWEAKEKSLNEKVENQDRLLKELKASYEVSQRLNTGETSEEDGGRGISGAELEIVSSELDRANARLAEVEARNEQLRLELAQSASSQPESATKSAIEDDPSFLRLQSENSSMLRRLENARFEKEAEKRKWAGDIRSLEREVGNLKRDNDGLRDKIHQWSDYENVKSELEVLKSIEFATGEDDDADRDDDATLESSNDHENGSAKKAETLEQLLLARNKKLSNELTVLRVSQQDLQSRLETLQDELSNTNMELEKSRNLTATLENDLELVQQEASNAFPSSAMSVAGTYVSRHPSSSMRRGRASSPTSSIISGFGGSKDEAAGGVGGGSGILPMMTAQRDRFKRKNAELETELQKQYQTVSSLRSEIASLQKDNLTLYEKTRYVSTYSRGSSAYAAGNGNPTAIQISSNDAASSGMSLETRYRPAYESSLSPFAAFRGRESARVFRGLTLPERFVFRIAKMVLATRTSRNMFAAYCFSLHLLVMMMLYWMSGSTVPVHKVTGINQAAAAAAGGYLAEGQIADPDWQKD